MTALDYLREISSALDGGYPGDCVVHAVRLAELLVAEKKAPWIGRLRDIQQLDSGVFHGPLIPMRLSGRGAPTWTTHYVACEGDDVYDPLAGVPVPLSDYPMRVFGRAIPLQRFLDAEETAELCRRHTLKGAIAAGAMQRSSDTLP